MCKQRMRLGCNRSKIDLSLHTGLRFKHRASIYRCRDYLPEVVSAPLKYWAPVPKFFQDRYVFTAITDSAIPKNCQYGANILGCRANFLVRVNGVIIDAFGNFSEQDCDVIKHVITTF